MLNPINFISKFISKRRNRMMEKSQIRPLAITSAMTRLTNSFLCNRLNQIVFEFQLILTTRQFGVAGNSSQDCVADIMMTITRMMQEELDVLVVKHDLANGFNSIIWSSIILALRRRGLERVQ